MIYIFTTIGYTEDLLKVERLHDNYSRLMFCEAHKILNDFHLTEDAVQQAFVRVIYNLHKVDENNEKETKNFLVTICVNIARDMSSKIRNTGYNEVVLEDNKISYGANPVDIVIDKESVSRVEDAIMELNPIYRDILILKETHDFSNEELARLFAITVETVKKRLYRARQTLKQALIKEGVK